MEFKSLCLGWGNLRMSTGWGRNSWRAALRDGIGSSCGKRDMSQECVFAPQRPNSIVTLLPSEETPQQCCSSSGIPSTGKTCWSEATEML